jgi:hypothetical protein
MIFCRIFLIALRSFRLSFLSSWVVLMMYSVIEMDSVLDYYVKVPGEGILLMGEECLEILNVCWSL